MDNGTIKGGINGIEISKERPGKQIDENVSRMWGGQARTSNQSEIDKSVNGRLGPTEQGIRDRLVADGQLGSRIRKFIVGWE